MNTACRICNSSRQKLLFRDEQVPVSQVPVTYDELGREEAGRMEIVLCLDCSHIFNRAFDEQLMRRTYAGNYTASLPLSPQSSGRYQKIADHLFRHAGAVDSAIEIGPGDFTFSKLLLERGVKRICAFEPARSFTNTDPRIHTIPDFFRVALTPPEFAQVDLIVIRHVLEHVADPAKMISDAAKLLKSGGLLYVEVPDVNDILAHHKFYDFIYEHVNHFSPRVLHRLLADQGIEPQSTESLANGQHMGVVAIHHGRPASVATAFGGESFPEVQSFESGQFLNDLQAIVTRHPSLAIYGAGAHSTMLCAMLKLTPEYVSCLYDLSPYKHGKFSPLTHIPIFSPTALHEHEALLILAPIHQDDIHHNLRHDFGYTGALYGVYPHIRRLP